MRPLSLPALVATLFLPPDAAHAQGAPNSFGIGASIVPDYDGSADYVARPSVTGRFAFGPATIELRGAGVRADVLQGPISAGPVLNYRFGRTDEVENPQVAALPEIEGAVELGAFASIPVGGNVALSAEILGDVSDVHGGMLTTLSADWRQPLTDRFDVFASASVSVMDDNFAQTYYGVTAEGAAASGLAAYAAGGGVRDVGLTLGASIGITEQASLTGTIGYRELLGDAADSPIVEVGDSGQMIATIGLNWEF